MTAGIMIFVLEANREILFAGRIYTGTKDDLLRIMSCTVMYATPEDTVPAIARRNTSPVLMVHEKAQSTAMNSMGGTEAFPSRYATAPFLRHTFEMKKMTSSTRQVASAIWKNGLQNKFITGMSAESAKNSLFFEKNESTMTRNAVISGRIHGYDAEMSAPA